VYNQRWAGFARQVAPQLFDFYNRAAVSRTHQAVLDLGCGTGQLGLYFLERGYRVVGLDLSNDMLEYARENCADYLGNTHARFERADITKFSMADRFGLVVSTYDALNHLESFDALRQCFRSVFPVLVDEGKFIFDLNTRLGLMRWNSVSVDEGDDAFLVTRGIYDGRGERAWMRVSGFYRSGKDMFQRFDETVFNTVYDLDAVRRALLESGWASVHFARVTDLAAPLDEPEKEGRVFVVAHK
jgi:SAM-dependent methyltransferase